MTILMPLVSRSAAAGKTDGWPLTGSRQVGLIGGGLRDKQNILSTSWILFRIPIRGTATLLPIPGRFFPWEFRTRGDHIRRIRSTGERICI